MECVSPKEGPFWSDHPVGIVDRPWVTEEYRQPCQQYIDFLRAPQQQEQAMHYGFRPGLEIIPLGAPLDRAVRLWDMSVGVARAVLKGHDWIVSALAFTPDGGSLLSGGADGTVRQWDVAAHAQRHSFRWLARWVACLAVAPNGMTAAAAGAPSIRQTPHTIHTCIRLARAGRLAV